MILVNQFWVFEKEEKEDIYQTLLKNCMNKHIKKIIIFIVGDTNVVLKHPKIQKVYVNKFLSTKKIVYDYLVYDDVYLISNNKIKFGKSILNFYKLNFTDENPIDINGTVIYKRINNIHTDGIKEIEYEREREYEHKPNSNSKSRSKKTQPKKSESEKTYKIKTTTKLPDSNKKEEGEEKEEKEEKEISKPINLQYKSKSKSKPKPKPKSKKRGSVPVKNINPKHPRNSNNKLAIVIHLYYQDLWFYFKERLEKIDYNYDLYVTLNESSTVGQTKWMKNKIEDFGGKVYILPNKGLDIGPFLYVMNLLFTKGKKYDYDYDYDYLIKLHSKKSIHNNIGDSWRNSLVNSLIGSDKILKDNIHKMNKDNKIGMLGSKEWILNDNKDYNNKYVNYYKDRLSIGKVPNKFIGGTMFMVDFNLLKKYFGKRAMNIYNELEEDYFQDHTEPKKTHSLERIFGSMVYDANKIIY